MIAPADWIAWRRRELQRLRRWQRELNNLERELTEDLEKICNGPTEQTDETPTDGERGGVE